MILVSRCICFQLNVFSERTWKVKVRAELAKYQKEIVSAIKNGYDGADYSGGSKQWSFAGAFLYSLTVITTIGKDQTIYLYLHNTGVYFSHYFSIFPIISPFFTIFFSPIFITAAIKVIYLQYTMVNRRPLHHKWD